MCLGYKLNVQSKMNEKNDKIKELQDRIAKLVSVKNDLEEKLLNAITDAILEISDKNPKGVTRTDNGIAVRMSMLRDKPWTPSLYDWKVCGAAVIDWLADKPASEYKNLLIAKLNETSNTSYVKIKTKDDTVTVSKEFIQEIIKQL